jgi:hypothetical protein
VALEPFIDRLFEANFARHVLGAFFASLLWLWCVVPLKFSDRISVSLNRPAF